MIERVGFWGCNAPNVLRLPFRQDLVFATACMGATREPREPHSAIVGGVPAAADPALYRYRARHRASYALKARQNRLRRKGVSNQPILAHAEGGRETALSPTS